MTDTKDFIATVTIKKLFTEPGRMFGFAATTAGEIVYIPGRLVSLLSVGEMVEVKLKPSNSPNAKFFMAELCHERKRRTTGLIVYDRERFNIVPRSKNVSTNM